MTRASYLLLFLSASAATAQPGWQMPSTMDGLVLSGDPRVSYDVVAFQLDQGKAATVTLLNESVAEGNGNYTTIDYYIDSRIAKPQVFSKEATAKITFVVSTQRSHVIAAQCGNHFATARKCEISVTGVPSVHLAPF